MPFQRPMEVDFGHTRGGLTTVAYSLDNLTWSTEGVVEKPPDSGKYQALVTFPDAFSGTLYWRTGDANERRAEENITDSPLFTSFVGTAYLSVNQAEDYFAGRLNSQAWDEASETDKAKALLAATRRIDALRFSGVRTSDLPVKSGQSLSPSSSVPQTLEFPRNGSTTIPVEIYSACCEIAFALLDGVDPEIELQNISTTQHGFASLQETYNSNIVNLAFRHGIPSVTAWTLLNPFLADPFQINIVRI